MSGETNHEDVADRWPTFTLSPGEYERAVADLVQDSGHEITDWQVTLLDQVEGVDGTYVIDVTVRFRLMGADFLMLFECKRHASPVKRQHLQVLAEKMQSNGAHKGVVVAATGFQRGALEYARIHGVACVRLLDGAWMHESRDSKSDTRRTTGTYVAYSNELFERGYSNTLLTKQQGYVRELLFGTFQEARQKDHD